MKKLQEGYDTPIKVMDFGCGVSPFPQFLANKGFDMWAVDDDSAGYIAHPGFDNLKRAYPDVNYHIGDIYDLNEKFDAIVSFSVLEHLTGEEDRLKIYSRMKELLNDNGKVCHVVDCYLPGCRRLDDIVDFISLADSFDILFDPAICPRSPDFGIENITDCHFVGFGTRVLVAHDV